MRVLNLYAGLGGNRRKWNEVCPGIQVTAVELDKHCAELYSKIHPQDTVLIEDAHDYLLKHYQEYDFIWSSPPCPTHSRARFWGSGANGKNPKYPDFTLYQEIVFLQHHFNGIWIVENVVPYYEPLIPGKKIGRHLFWSSKNIPGSINHRRFPVSHTKNELEKLTDFHEIDFSQYKGKQRRTKVARNLVDYILGKELFSHLTNKSEDKDEQLGLLFKSTY